VQDRSLFLLLHLHLGERVLLKIIKAHAHLLEFGVQRLFVALVLVKFGLIEAHAHLRRLSVQLLFVAVVVIKSFFVHFLLASPFREGFLHKVFQIGQLFLLVRRRRKHLLVVLLRHRRRRGDATLGGFGDRALGERAVARAFQLVSKQPAAFTAVRGAGRQPAR